MGYSHAGFEVVGVDIKPQPRYPFAFVQMDALMYLGGSSRRPPAHWQTAHYFDAIHASPPCQFATAYKRTGNVKPSENLIPQTRELLEATGLPYVIENVSEARPWLHDPMMLCGSHFELFDIERHRLFETNWPLEPPIWPCRHKLSGVDRFPGGRSVTRTGHSRGLVRGTMEIGSWDISFAKQQEAMGIDWMTLEELSEAIPPAYTEFIGAQLMAHLKTKDHTPIISDAMRQSTRPLDVKK